MDKPKSKSEDEWAAEKRVMEARASELAKWRASWLAEEREVEDRLREHWHVRLGEIYFVCDALRRWIRGTLIGGQPQLVHDDFKHLLSVCVAQSRIDAMELCDMHWVDRQVTAERLRTHDERELAEGGLNLPFLWEWQHEAVKLFRYVFEWSRWKKDEQAVATFDFKLCESVPKPVEIGRPSPRTSKPHSNNEEQNRCGNIVAIALRLPDKRRRPRTLCRQCSKKRTQVQSESRKQQTRNKLNHKWMAEQIAMQICWMNAEQRQNHLDALRQRDPATCEEVERALAKHWPLPTTRKSKETRKRPLRK